MSRSVSWLAALSLLFGFIVSQAPAQTVDVIVLSGQSNAQGEGVRVSELPSSLRGNQSDVFFADRNNRTWRTLDPPTSGKYEPSLDRLEGFGPEVTFARRVADRTNRPVYIYKQGHPGASLDESFLNPGGHYDQMLSQCQEALDNLQSQYGVTGRITGFLWMQGESDANDAMSKVYYQNLDFLIEGVRERLPTSDMKVVIGRLSNYQNYAAWNRVRDEQVRLANDKPGATWVDTDSFGRFPDDGIHFNASGLQDLGSAFADAYLSLRGDDSLEGIWNLSDNWTGRSLSATSGDQNWSSAAVAYLNPDWSSQMWYFEPVGGNVYRLQNLWNGRYLTDAQGTNWGPVVCSDKQSWTSMQWALEPADNPGQYRLRNVWTGRYLSGQPGDWWDALVGNLDDSYGSMIWDLNGM